MRNRILAAFALCTLACHPDTTVVEVALNNIPMGARSLLLSVRLGGQAAEQLDPVALPNAGFHPIETVGLRLSTQSGAGDKLVVGAGVVDGNDCPLAVGLTQTVYQEQPMSISLDLQPAPPSSTGACNLQQPIIFGVTPSSASTTSRASISLHGWSFDPKASASIDRQPLEDLLWNSANELTGKVPQDPGAFGHQLVRVDNPDNSYAQNNNLFSYFASTIVFADHTCVNPAGAGSSHFQFAVGNVLAGTTGPELVRVDQESGRTEIFTNLSKRDPNQAPTVQSLGVPPRAVALVARNSKSPADLVFTTDGDGGILLFGNQGPLNPFSGQQPFRTFIDLAPSAVTSVLRGASIGSDLVVTDAAVDEVNILFRQTSGFFSRRARATFAVDREPISVVAADVDGDQQPDLIIGHQTANVISVLLQTPTASQAWSAPAVAVQVPMTYHSLTAGDVNGDGTADLIFADDQSASASTIHVYFMPAGGSFVPVSTTALSTPGRVTSLLAVDLDGDGHSEVVAGLSQSPTLQIYTGSGAGNTLMALPNLPSSTSPVTALLALNYGPDQLIDLVAADGSTGTVNCWQNLSQ